MMYWGFIAVGAGAVTIDLNLAAVVVAIGSLAGAVMTVRTIGPQRQKILADVRNAGGEDADRLMQHYKSLLNRADVRITECEKELDVIELEREDWRIERFRLMSRVTGLEDLLRKNGIDPNTA